MQVSTSPLLFEFGVEKLYPISEGMIGGWLNIWCISSCISFKTHFYKKIQLVISGWLFVVTMLTTRYNIISVIFLGIFTIPHIGVKWLSYVLPFSCFSVLPIMLMVKEEYKRRTVDDEEKEDDEEEGGNGSDDGN